MSMNTQAYQLHVYSAGAVAPPLQKAIDVFENKFGIRCNLTTGKPSNLLASIAVCKEGDVISCGAEYILDEAEDRGLVTKGSRRTMGFRRSVILVPIGNPAKITSLNDLCRENVRIGIAIDGCLKGVWDDIASKAGLTDKIRQNIIQHADACGSLMGLIHQEKVDAIFGWNAFQNIWPDTSEAIELPQDLQVFRSTVVAMIFFTKNAELSQKFINFLTTNEVRDIYSDYGWIHKR
jgi:molybdate transport system substrate-binding protein